MANVLRVGWVLTLSVAGCVSTPVENPVLVQQMSESENPALVSPGVPTAVSYAEIFEKAVDVLDDYFVIKSFNRYAGTIETWPRVAPGYEQFFRSGNPDPRSRLMATFQSVRQTATLTIRASERGGFLVMVVVEKELEDLPRPNRATIGRAAFHDVPTVERQVEVIDPEAMPGRGWYSIGRDCALEQKILQRIQGN